MQFQQTKVETCQLHCCWSFVQTIGQPVIMADYALVYYGNLTTALCIFLFH